LKVRSHTRWKNAQTEDRGEEIEWSLNGKQAHAISRMGAHWEDAGGCLHPSVAVQALPPPPLLQNYPARFEARPADSTHCIPRYTQNKNQLK